MIATIHQPQFMPWIGYFDKMEQADVFVYLDNVQFKKNEWQNRNRLKTAQGWQWLTVPVLHKFPQTILEVGINDEVDWKSKHLNALATNYSKAPFYKHYWEQFKEFYERDWRRLADINIGSVELLKSLMGLSVKTVLASDLKTKGDSTQRLVEICKEMGADTYISGPDGVKYMDTTLFAKNDIKVVFHDFHHPVYAQLYGDFISHLSIVDLLFNYGPNSLETIRKERKPCKTMNFSFCGDR